LPFRIRPIGILRNSFTERIPDGWETSDAQIVLDKRWSKALEGIEGFSHLIVLFWLHHVSRRGIRLQSHPQRRDDLPLVGIFATRTPHRPNPIGVQVVELIGHEDNVLTIRGIDALDGSPIIDIKPYLEWGDAVPAARVPDWLQDLWAERGHPGGGPEHWKAR